MNLVVGVGGLGFRGTLQLQKLLLDLNIEKFGVIWLRDGEEPSRKTRNECGFQCGKSCWVWHLGSSVLPLVWRTGGSIFLSTFSSFLCSNAAPGGFSLPFTLSQFSHLCECCWWNSPTLSVLNSTTSVILCAGKKEITLKWVVWSTFLDSTETGLKKSSYCAFSCIIYPLEGPLTICLTCSSLQPDIILPSHPLSQQEATLASANPMLIYLTSHQPEWAQGPLYLN